MSVSAIDPNKIPYDSIQGATDTAAPSGVQTAATAGAADLPPASAYKGVAGNDPTPLYKPTASLPSGLELKNLIELILQQTSFEDVKGSQESIRSKGSLRQANFQKQLAEITERTSKNAKNASKSVWQKILGWFVAAFTLIAAAFSFVAAAVTGGATLVAGVGMICLALVAINQLISVISEAAGKEVNLGSLFAVIVKAANPKLDPQEVDKGCGIFNMAFNLVCGLAGAVCSGVAALGQSAATAARAFPWKFLGMVASIGSSVTDVPKSGLEISMANDAYALRTSGFTMQKLMLALEKIMQDQKREEEFLEALVKKDQTLVKIVKDVVEQANAAMQAVVTGTAAPSIPA